LRLRRDERIRSESAYLRPIGMNDVLILTHIHYIGKLLCNNRYSFIV